MSAAANMPPDEYFGDVADLPIGEDAPSAPWASCAIDSRKEWYTQAPPKRSWLLTDARAGGAGVFPRGKVGAIIGEGGVSKTMAQIDCAIAVVLGGAWLGTFTVATPGRVLLLLGEEDSEEVRRRLYSVARARTGDTPEDGSIVALPLAGIPCAMIEADNQGNPQDTTFLRWLRAYVKDHGPFVLVVVDPLSRFAGADAEINNAAMTRFVQALESIAAETGASVLVSHHTNKLARTSGATATAAASRGSSAFTDGIRWAAALTAEKVAIDDPAIAERLGELVTLTVVKSNYARKPEPIVLRRDHRNSGALLPLDTHDEMMIDEAREEAEPSTRRRTQREEQERARMAAIASSVRDVLRATPGLSGRALLAAVQARRGQCSRPTLEAAIALMGDEVETKRGPDRSTLHFLTDEGAP